MRFIGSAGIPDPWVYNPIAVPCREADRCSDDLEQASEQETPVLTLGFFTGGLLNIDYDIPHGRSGVSAMIPDGYPGDDTLMAERDTFEGVSALL
jgi:hypothetical protein